MIKYFPAALKGQPTEWNLSGNIVGSGQTGVGVNPIVRLDGGGLWMAKISNVYLRSVIFAKLWRAARMIADGGVTPMIVADCDGMQPWPLDESGQKITQHADVPHDDDAYFDDDTGYAQPVIDVVTVGSGALRGTTLTFEILVGATLLGGEAFSINHPTYGFRRYEIKTVVIDEDEFTRVTFSPPLREACASGTRIEFDLVRCVMKAATVSALDYVHDKHPLARQSASWSEAFPPFV